MERPEQAPRQGAELNFTHPVTQIILMLSVLGAVGFGVSLVLPQVMPVIQANIYLNAFILTVFAIGLLACFWQVWQIRTSVSWIKGFTGDRDGGEPLRAPRLLAPLAALLGARGARMQIGAASSRSILDSVATRIDEARDITRYITNLLIFLGLLGTFYGLATTVPAVVDTIRSLAPSEGEGGVEVFNRLMTGLEEQLGGMGTAFSSSLLGLAGSLVVARSALPPGRPRATVPTPGWSVRWRRIWANRWRGCRPSSPSRMYRALWSTNGWARWRMPWTGWRSGSRPRGSRPRS